MNVIVSNKQKEIIDNANIDAIKDLNGLFNVNDLINKFKNYFFSKMILDATSIIDFASNEVLTKLADEIGPDRLIILLPKTPEPPDEFKKLLINLKIYNFSDKIEDVVKFIEEPNTYEKAMSLVKTSYDDGYYVDNSVHENEEDNRNLNNYNDDSNDVNMTNDSNNNFNNSFHSSLGDIMNRISISDNYDSTPNDNDMNEPKSNLSFEDQVNYDSNDTNSGMSLDDVEYNESNNEVSLSNYSLDSINDNLETHNNNTNTEIRHNTFLNMDDFDNTTFYSQPKKKSIIGIKNVTEHAGSTTLIYLLHQVAQKNNREVLSLEINKDEFKLFRNSKMVSVKENDIHGILDSLHDEIVFVDLNDCHDDSFCDDIIYLVEPSIIKLNKLMIQDKYIFNTLKGKKVILNQSMLSSSDIPILENEAGIEFFFNISSVNDRIDNSIIKELFDKLFTR